MMPLKIDLNKLIELHVPELPVGWQRTRGEGKNRFAPQELRDWKNYLAEFVQNEILAYDLEEVFPFEGRVFVSISVYYEEEEKLDRSSDWDNVAKAIMDGLSGVLWPDDKPKYSRGGSVWLDLAPEESVVGTWIVVYEV